MKFGLRLKLTLAFVAVAAVAVGVAAIFVGLQTPGRVDRLASAVRGASAVIIDRTPRGEAPPSDGMRGPIRGAHRTPQEQFVDETVISLFIGFGVAVGVALILGSALSGGITDPLRRLSLATQRLAKGDRSARVGVESGDEIGQVALAFDDMAGALDAQETARRNLFADIAHEIRTPLTVIEGAVGAMLDGTYPRTDENLQVIHDRARGLDRLVQDIRDLSLADVGQLSLDLTDVDVAKIVTEIRREAKALADAKGVGLEAQASDPVMAIADSVRLRQVLANLVENAIRHTALGGLVGLAVRREGARVRVDVVDTGEGIDPKDLSHVFDRFYRADPSRNRASGGSGLGLAIVRALVSAMRGEVGVTSRPGAGSTFTVWLPDADS